jgi:hypothetical protein
MIKIKQTVMKQIFLTVLTVCCLMITTAAEAQNFRKQDVPKHELSIYGLVGYSPLSYTLSHEGAKSGGIGGGAGLGYTFNIKVKDVSGDTVNDTITSDGDFIEVRTLSLDKIKIKSLMIIGKILNRCIYENSKQT